MLRRFLLGLALVSLVVSPVSSQSKWIGAFGGVTADSTDTFTNKTIDVNGTGNSLTNIDVADLATGTDGELITWNSSGNPAVVAAGDAAQVLTSNGAGAAPTMQAAGGGVAAYSTTLTDVISTTSETDVWTFTVPADAWADGDVVFFRGWFLVKNNSGGSATFTPKLYVGGVSIETRNNSSQADNASERLIFFGGTLFRAGSNVYMQEIVGSVSSQLELGADVMGAAFSGWDAGTFDLTWTPAFNSNVIVKMSLTPSANNATTYVKMQQVMAYKIAAG